jgi:hypothetical protein
MIDARSEMFLFAWKRRVVLWCLVTKLDFEFGKGASMLPHRLHTKCPSTARLDQMGSAQRSPTWWFLDWGQSAGMPKLIGSNWCSRCSKHKSAQFRATLALQHGASPGIIGGKLGKGAASAALHKMLK